MPMWSIRPRALSALPTPAPGAVACAAPAHRAPTPATATRTRRLVRLIAVARSVGPRRCDSVTVPIGDPHNPAVVGQILPGQWHERHLSEGLAQHGGRVDLPDVALGVERKPYVLRGLQAADAEPHLVLSVIRLPLCHGDEPRRNERAGRVLLGVLDARRVPGHGKRGPPI